MATIDERPAALAKFSLFILLFSLFFWIWALVNTVNNGFVDGGIVCFLGSALSATYMLATANAKAMPKSKSSKILATVSYIFVAVVYALGVYINLSMSGRTRQAVYCGVFVALWLGLAYHGHQLMNKAEPPPPAGESARLRERIQKQTSRAGVV